MRVETPTCRLITRALSHVGYVRLDNEDAVLDMPEAGLWAVADGMGGHRDGAFASASVIEALRTLGHRASGRRLVEQVGGVLQSVNDALIARGGGEIIGSTVVALVLEEEHFHFFWCGDSRLYLFRDGQLRRLTRDHSDPATGSGALTHAVGAEATLGMEYSCGVIYENDLFLLCSDGLTKVVTDAAIAGHLSEEPAERACEVLIKAALDKGGPDNVSCVTVYLST